MSGDGVRLRPLSAAEDPHLLARVLRLRPHPEQEVFSARAADTFPAAAADPDRTAFAVLAGEEPVGFGVLDRRGWLEDLVDDPDRAVLLRAFYIAAEHQGRGYGARAARAARALAAALVPTADLVVLTVNERNPAAQRAYARAGFVDTGTRYLGGGAGPQRVMVAAASPLPRAAASPPPRAAGSPLP
ncbi:GNAT family N-acetyltransferase [Quadrisphaera sp. DSM 44207]|uniref:GNAT family N-acetyltransferase n=1 Tax=Quadrisphaera sp. DSM 44207 TaxID=1881057 RepID=UPI000891032D|nr:GNAT family N-acetyltransferase [Quadrisphaera sp. DSM 44207]SDQ04860.1 Protein N-acetyltransferase, RimJ/RimL family [Quadrisphaera sp. DSM 44207]